MKNVFKKIGLSLAALSCVACAGVGISLANANEVSTVKADETAAITPSDYWMSGVGLRLENDADGVGVRFHTNLTLAEYEQLTGDFKTGTLIIPEIRYDGELTLDDLNNPQYRPVNVDTTNLWYDTVLEDGERMKRTTAYLYNIPESAYGVRYVARSYIQYADGTVAYAYTHESNFKSLVDVAIKANVEAKDEQVKAQVAPFIIDDVTVTYNMPDGKVTQNVAYAGKVTPDEVITYDKDVYQINKWTDQYGREWDVENGQVTMPLTLTPTFMVRMDTVLMSSALYGDKGSERLTEVDADGAVAPKGFEQVTRYVSNEKWTSGVMSPAGYNNVSLAIYDEVWFALKLQGASLIISGETLFSDDWIYFHLKQTADSIWTIEITINGKVKTLEDQSGTDRSYNADTYERANAISTILYGQGVVDSCNDGGSVLINKGTKDVGVTMYSTEVRTNRNNSSGMPSAEAENITDENGESIWALYGDKGSDRLTAVDADGTVAPEGFYQVMRYDSNEKWTSGAMAPAGYNNVSLAAYDEVWFALKLQGAGLIISGETLFSNDWIYFHLTQTADSIWTIEITINGKVKTLEDQSGTDRSYNSDTYERPNAISTILYGQGAVGGCNDGGSVLINKGTKDVGVTMYSTEVRAIKPEQIVPSTSETNMLFDERGNSIVAIYGDKGSDRLTEASADGMVAPEGFEQVARYDSNSAWASGAMSPAGYNNHSLAAYDEVWFALKLQGAGLIISGETFYSNDWIYFHLMQTADSIWTIEITINGEVKTLENQSGTERGYNSDTYERPNAISTILYGQGAVGGCNDGGSVLINKSTAGVDVTIYTTEVRVIKPEQIVPSSETNMLFDERGNSIVAIYGDKGSDRLTEASADGMVAPEGFEQVARYDSNEKWTSGAMAPAGYNNVSLAAYDEVWFALKLQGAGLIISGETLFSNDWIYFHLTQTADSIWTIEITINGEVRTLKNQSGTDRSYNSDTYERPNAISTILYGQGAVGGCNDGGSVLINKGTKDVGVTIYTTEIRVSRGDRAVWSAIDGAAISKDEIGVSGFDALYKLTGFTPANFAKIDLTGKGYNYVRFAFRVSSDCTMTINKETKTITANVNWYVTLTETASGWTVTLNNLNGTSYTFATAATNIAAIFADMQFVGGVESAIAYCTEVRATHICSAGGNCPDGANCA